MRFGLVCLVAVSAFAQPNTLTPQEKAAGWKLLFDGKTLEEWLDPAKDTPPGDAWVVEDGTIRTKAKPKYNEDLISKDSFLDYELTWEWKISLGGNSGLKYRIQDRFWLGTIHNTPGPGSFEKLVNLRYRERLPTRNPNGRDQEYVVALEYQLIDDERHPDALTGPKRKSGAIYASIPPSTEKAVKPAGEWNQSRLIVKGNHVEHWLNGVKVVDASLDDPRIAEAAAKRWGTESPIYQMLAKQPKRSTPISLQNHGDDAWFRNIKIRPL
jgi:hypothetical protein